MSFTFKLRNGTLKIPKSEIEGIMFEDWFISKLVCNDIDKIEDDEDDREFELWEDLEVFKIIFESMRFQKLIINENENINFSYLLALAEKWCCPKWLIDEINLHTNLEKKKIFNSLELNIKKCSNCGVGYNVNENNKDSCVYHSNVLSKENVYFCCGHTYDSINVDNPLNKGCKRGYHVCTKESDIYNIQKIAEMFT